MTSVSCYVTGGLSLSLLACPKAPRSHLLGWRCFLSSHPSELGREPCLARNEPGDKRKDEAYRESTHQYASATFYYAQNSPRPGKNQISGSDRRITATREIQCRFPG